MLQLKLRRFHVCYPGLVLKSLLLDLKLLYLRLLTLKLLSSFLVQILRFLEPANQLQHLLLLLCFALAGLVKLQLNLLQRCDLTFALGQLVLQIFELQFEVLLLVLLYFQELLFVLEFVGDLGKLLFELVGFVL